MPCTDIICNVLAMCVEVKCHPLRWGDIGKFAGMLKGKVRHIWNSMTVNLARNVADPNVGFEMTADDGIVKCYMLMLVC